MTVESLLDTVESSDTLPHSVAENLSTCTVCGTKFKGPSQKKKCRKDCGRTNQHKARTVKRENNELNFIGVDGEGVDRPNGDHEYIMLSVGNKTLANADGSQLNHDQIFTFLWEQFLANQNAAFIGFFLGYDFDQWLKSVTAHEARMLLTREGIGKRKRKVESKNPEPFPVYVDNKWEIDLLGKRRFRLAKHSHRYPSGDNIGSPCRCGEPFYEIEEPDTWDVPDSSKEISLKEYYENGNRSHNAKRMYICDTGPFWQMSFLKVVHPSNWPDGSIISDAEYELLKRGKDTRGIIAAHGDTSYYDDMVKYNRLENDVLARVTTRLNEGFISIGIKVPPRDWYGPGRPAQIWLNSHLKPDDRISHEAIDKAVPKYAIEAGRKSYYGGWFEQFMHGHIKGTVFEYDINSAYPYIISNLPCLMHGKWSQGKGHPPIESMDDLILLHVETVGSDPFIGGLPHRSKKGHITHPLSTIGWYWKHEIDAAVNAKLIDNYTVSAYVRYEPCSCDCPLEDIANLYGKRIGLGLNLTDDERNTLKDSAVGKAYKCVYNSSYGKFAQSIGNPRFGNSIYASLITAGCRTLILEAIATHPERSKAVTMIATDGIYFTSPHPMHTDKYRLGGWDVKKIHGMTQFMPGIYWDNKARKAISNGESLKLKSRGIGAKDLANSINALDDQFDIFDYLPRNIGGDIRMMSLPFEADEFNNWPALELKIEFSLTSCLQAIIRNDWPTAAKVTHNGKRKIDSTPRTKRRSGLLYPDGNGNWRTNPYPHRSNKETAYYDKRFGFNDEGNAELKNLMVGWGVAVDGDVSDLMGFMMRAGWE